MNHVYSHFNFHNQSPNVKFIRGQRKDSLFIKAIVHRVSRSCSSLNLKRCFNFFEHIVQFHCDLCLFGVCSSLQSFFLQRFNMSVKSRRVTT